MAEETTTPPVNKTVDELRRVFTPMTSRLTLETESALEYRFPAPEDTPHPPRQNPARQHPSVRAPRVSKGGPQ